MPKQGAWACLILCSCLLAADHIHLQAAASALEVPINQAGAYQPSNQPHRKLQASLSLYCNVTGTCGPCHTAHMKSEACRLTGHAEKLSCVTDSQSPHEVVLHVHRHINTMWQPLHISRACQHTTAGSTATGPDSKGASTTGGSDGSTSSGISQHDWAPASEGSRVAESVSTVEVSSSKIGSSEGGSSESRSTEAEPQLRHMYLSGSTQSGMGALNVLYFELAMLLLLSGSLPVVYIRKRRFVRL